MMIFNKGEEDAAGLYARSQKREVTLMKSTMALVASFMTDGDIEDDAKNKVKQLSDEITSSAAGSKYDFVLGNTQPLKDAVQNSALEFMTQAKKDIVINILNQAI